MTSAREYAARWWQWAFIGIMAVALAGGFLLDAAGAFLAALLVVVLGTATLWLDRRVRTERHRVSMLEQRLGQMERHETDVQRSATRDGRNEERLDAEQQQLIGLEERLDRYEQGHVRISARVDEAELALQALVHRLEESSAENERWRRELSDAVHEVARRSAAQDGPPIAVELPRLTRLTHRPIDPLVSIVVVCSDHGHLERCLDSIRIQDFDDFECAVAGVGSADDDAIVRIVAELHDPRFFVRAPGELRTAGAVLNSAVASASADYCIIMTSADLLLQPSLGARFDETWKLDQRGAGVICNWDVAGSRPDDQVRTSAVVLDLVCSDTFVSVPLAAVMIRTAALKAIGGFNEALADGVGLEFFVRLLRHRFTFAHLDVCGVIVEPPVGSQAITEGSGDVAEQVEQYLARGMVSDEIGDIGHEAFVDSVQRYRSDLELCRRLMSLLTLALLRRDDRDTEDLLGRFPDSVDLLSDHCLDCEGVVRHAIERFAWTTSGRRPAEAVALVHRVRRLVDQLQRDAAARRVRESRTAERTAGSQLVPMSHGVGTVTWRGDDWSRVDELRAMRAG